LVVALTLWASYGLARNTGYIGVSTSGTGCVCHDSSPNASGNATVSITGPQTVDAGTTADYTITVTGGPSSTTGGFNLSADGGTLVAGANNQLDTGQLTHVDRDSRSWSFQWQAPGTAGNQNLFAVAMATNGNGSSGDSWNWYGDAAGTGFQIEVRDPVQILPSTWGRIKRIYR
jgi:hypothetical protein